MKVYYTASYVFRQDNQKIYKKTSDYLKKLFGNKNVYYANDQIDVPFNDEESPHDILTATKYRQKALKNSDILIADVTQGSAGIGYNISFAVSLKKPVLVLRKKMKSEKLVHHLIDSGKIKQIKYEEYTTAQDIQEHIKQFIKSSKEIMDTKFIMIISPEIDKYLEWASDYKRMHKAQIVRNAITTYMEADKDWQEFLQEEA